MGSNIGAQMSPSSSKIFAKMSCALFDWLVLSLLKKKPQQTTKHVNLMVLNYSFTCAWNSYLFGVSQGAVLEAVHWPIMVAFLQRLSWIKSWFISTHTTSEPIKQNQLKMLTAMMSFLFTLPVIWIITGFLFFGFFVIFNLFLNAVKIKYFWSSPTKITALSTKMNSYVSPCAQ